MFLTHTLQRERNIVSRDELRDNIARLSRDPFGDVLEALLQARPSTERLLAWAAEHPDRWANAIKVFAHLKGYTERSEVVSTNFYMQISRMSDAEVLQCLSDIQQGGNAEMAINKYIEAKPPQETVQNLNASSEADIDGSNIEATRGQE